MKTNFIAGLMGLILGAWVTALLMTEFSTTHKQWNNLQETCEASLPRDQFCVMTAVVE